MQRYGFFLYMQKIRKPVNMAILQPEVHHYRTEFFQKLANNMKKLDIFIFNPISVPLKWDELNN